MQFLPTFKELHSDSKAAIFRRYGEASSHEIFTHVVLVVNRCHFHSLAKHTQRKQACFRFRLLNKKINNANSLTYCICYLFLFLLTFYILRQYIFLTLVFIILRLFTLNKQTISFKTTWLVKCSYKHAIKKTILN